VAVLKDLRLELNTNHMSCTVTDFNPILTDLASVWASLWPDLNDKVPTATGLSFGASNGSCWGICGSLGITACNGFEYLVPDTAAATMAWSTCGPVDAAVLSVPLPAVPMNYSVQGRATGLGSLWPGAPGAEAFAMTGQVFGLVLITVPIADGGKIANYRDLSVDVKFYFTITSAWPDTSNDIFLAVPIGQLSLTYSTTVNDKVSEYLSTQLRKNLQMQGQTLTCSAPSLLDQTCLVGTTMPGSPCNPCDKCCTCMIQQKCDGECLGCPCVSCNLWSEGLSTSATYVLFMFIVIVFVVAWLLRFT